MKLLTTALGAAMLAALAGCGGDDPAQSGGIRPVEPPPIVPEQPVIVPPVDPAQPPVPPPLTAIEEIGKYRQHCADAPPDSPQAGTVDDEKRFLRAWLGESYLWYRELPALDLAAYATAVSYFDAMKTPLTTASGKPKDQYHFSYTEARWAELSRGGQTGYGLTWLRSTADGVRDWRIAAVEPGSPAALAGLRRGDRLLTVDGIDFAGATDAASIAALNAALSPATAGASHQLTVRRADGDTVEARLTAVKLAIAPVQNTTVLQSATGPVGYLTFGAHVAGAEAPLTAAFASLRDAGVKDLVLDLRYNGGGLLSIASKVAYMIAGPQAAGKTFEHTLANDKTKPNQPILFPASAQLPYLGLRRVYVLAGPGTCSASESIVNGLRGADVDVHLVGGQTCGKPYAFIPATNCGRTYFAIQYQGVNHKGFGDYADGFAPTCAAADDLRHPLGSLDETLLRTALQLRADGTCPVSAAARAGARAPQLVPVREPASEIAIDDRP
ncbi:S41 family peptidase [Pseudoduganella armeniaca]|nr:S41 family peptidase [Pseudoduganella armeniaca]